MRQKDFDIEVIAQLENLNALRIKNGKLPLARFWTGVAHRLHTYNGGTITSLSQYWIPGWFKKDEQLASVISVLIEVENGNYK